MEPRSAVKRAAVVALYGLGALAAAAAGFSEVPTDFQLWMMASAAVLASVAAFVSDQWAGPLQKTWTIIKKTPNLVDLADLVDQVHALKNGIHSILSMLSFGLRLSLN